MTDIEKALLIFLLIGYVISAPSVLLYAIWRQRQDQSSGDKE